MLVIDATPTSLERFVDLVDDRTLDGLAAVARTVAGRLEGRTLWHVNSTAEGGGVAEMLHPLVGYYLGCGIATRWVVIDADEAFFRVTKRLHNRLHGRLGDGGALDADARAVYDATLTRNLSTLRAEVRAGDVVVLHDPQTLGLAPAMSEAGALVIWICHVGVDAPDPVSRSAWSFLENDVAAARAAVFSRAAYVWDTIASDRSRIIPPFIDPFAPKNVELEDGVGARVLAAADITQDGAGETSVIVDAREIRVRHRPEAFEMSRLDPEVPAIVQVSRWDRLKDPDGVLTGFLMGPALTSDAHLVLAGPQAAGVSDDPEGEAVFGALTRWWEDLPAGPRGRVHLLGLPMHDPVENALIVNALQRHASVIVQKSLAEGFGLTVTEGMWKERVVVAGRVGGIQDQIVDGDTGLLVDPRDLEAFAAALGRALDGEQVAGMGGRAKERVRAAYLPPHHLSAHLTLMRAVIDGEL